MGCRSIQPSLPATRDRGRCVRGSDVGMRSQQRDLAPQMNELGPSNGYNFGVANQWAPDLKPAYSNEFSVDLQHQLPGNLVVSGGYMRSTRSVWRPNTLVPPTSYTPMTVTEVASGETVTVYNQSPATKGPVQQRLVERRRIGRRLSRRRPIGEQAMSNGWSLMGGANFGKGEGHGDHRRSEQSEFPRLQNRSLWKRCAVVVPGCRCL